MASIKLPNEIWLEIFSYLNYFELKNCMRVDKAFQTFTDHPTCQKEMFRYKAVVPKGGTINIDDVETHPAFGSMSYECATELDEVYFANDAVLTDTCAAQEYATYPPVAFLRLQILDWPAIQVTNKMGVTVLQVMKSLCRFFSKHGSFEATSGRTGWTDWDEMKLDRTGTSCSKPTTLIPDR
jgi:hypothetical protein